MKEKFASSKFSTDFNILQELYRSNGGTVYKAVFKYDKKTYVVKERNLAELGKRKDMMNEVKLLQQVAHRNIVRCEGWFRDDVSSDRLYMVLEYCENGDLYHLLQYYLKHPCQKQQPVYLTEQQIWYIFQQITAGLYHLHENGIIHRDMKSLNILITGGYSVFKIGDLGVSRQLSEATLMIHTFYGTPYYLSPEMLENKAYNEKTDIWSLGILLYELCAYTTPFRAPSFIELMKVVLKGEYQPISSHFSTPLKRMVPWLLSSEYRKRPTISQVVDFIAEQVGPAGGYYGAGLNPEEFPTYQLEHRKGQPPIPPRTSATAQHGGVRIPGVAPPPSTVPIAAAGSASAAIQQQKQSQPSNPLQGLSNRPPTASRHRPTSPSPPTRKLTSAPEQRRPGTATAPAGGGEDSIDEDSLDGQEKQQQRFLKKQQRGVGQRLVGREKKKNEEPNDDDTISTASEDDGGESIASSQAAPGSLLISPPVRGAPVIGTSSDPATAAVRPRTATAKPQATQPQARRRSIILPDPVSSPPSPTSSPDHSPSRKQHKRGSTTAVGRGSFLVEGEGAEEMVEIDAQRVQIKLRKEIMKYRKLLQMRDFMLGAGAGAGEEVGVGGGGGGVVEQDTGEVGKRLKEAQRSIKVLEYCIDSPQQRIPLSLATRYNIPVKAKAVVLVKDPTAAQLPVMMFEDNLPVYFQPPPSGRRRSPSASPSPPRAQPRIASLAAARQAQPQIKPYNAGVEHSFLLPTKPPSSSAADAAVVGVVVGAVGGGGAQPRQHITSSHVPFQTNQVAAAAAVGGVLVGEDERNIGVPIPVSIPAQGIGRAAAGSNKREDRVVERVDVLVGGGGGGGGQQQQSGGVRRQQLFSVNVHFDHKIPSPSQYEGDGVPTAAVGSSGGGGLLLPSMVEDADDLRGGGGGVRKTRPHSAAPRIASKHSPQKGGAIPLGAIPHFAPGLPIGGPAPTAPTTSTAPPTGPTGPNTGPTGAAGALSRPRSAVTVGIGGRRSGQEPLLSDHHRYYDHGKPITDITSPYDRPQRNANDHIPEVLHQHQPPTEVPVAAGGNGNGNSGGGSQKQLKKDPSGGIGGGIGVGGRVIEMQLPGKKKQQGVPGGAAAGLVVAVGAEELVGGGLGKGIGSQARLIQQRQQTSYNIISGV